jgi:hypothetical protein
MNVRVVTRSSGTTSVTTSATGSEFVALPAARALQANLLNYSGTDIEWRIGTGTPITLKANMGYTVTGLQNANNVSLRRVDQSNTPTTVQVHFQD